MDEMELHTYSSLETIHTLLTEETKCKVKNISNEVIQLLCQVFPEGPETEIPDCTMSGDCLSELKTLLEENKTLSDEVEKTEQGIALSQSKMQSIKEDKKILVNEIKVTHDAMLTARKYFKKFLEIYPVVETSTDKGHSICIQYFTESKRDSDNYSVKFFKDNTSGKYELTEVKPKIKSFSVIKKALQETGDVPYALASIRLEFLKIKNK